MKTEEFLRRYEMLVPEMLADNREEFVGGLLGNLGSEDTYEELYMKMIMNSIEIAAQSAVQITLRILAEAGIINDENLKHVEFKKPPLNLVKDGKGDEKRLAGQAKNGQSALKT